MQNRLQSTIEHARKMRSSRLRKERIRVAEIGPLIYFVQSGKYIKVGISSRAAIAGRVNTFRVSSPYPVKLLKVLHTKHPRRDERTFHKLLKPYHVRGEWFLIDNAAILELLGA